MPPLIQHKKFIDSLYEEEKPKKKRRLTTYNKFLRKIMPSVREKFPLEKRGRYMQIIGAMWKTMTDNEKKKFVR
jgi:hypothetical protein